jgi:hypothetical protein
MLLLSLELPANGRAAIPQIALLSFAWFKTIKQRFIVFCGIARDRLIYS